MTERAIKKKRIRRDCWELDQAFLKWLKERLPVYLREGGKFIDLKYNMYPFHGEQWSQEALIKRMIELLDKADKCDLFDPSYMPTVNEILEIWSLVFHAMWW